MTDTLHEDLVAFFTQDPELVAAMPGGITAEFVGQGAVFPAMTFTEVSADEVGEDLEHQEDGEEKLIESRYQIDVEADTMKAARDAFNIADRKLRTLRGKIGATTIQSTQRTSRSHQGFQIGDKTRRRITADYAITFEDRI